MAINESMDEGPFEEYFDDGTLKRKGSRKCGSYDGPFEEYYENGQLKVKCSYSEGLTNGPYERYWENGQLFFKECYKQIPEIKAPDYSTSPSTLYYHFFDDKRDGRFLFNLKDKFKSSIEYLRRIRLVLFTGAVIDFSLINFLNLKIKCNLLTSIVNLEK